MAITSLNDVPTHSTSIDFDDDHDEDYDYDDDAALVARVFVL